MLDLARIGGVTGWLAAATLADIAGIEMSSHLHHEASAHRLSATPTAHWIEYVDWAAPILAEPLTVTDGHRKIFGKPFAENRTYRLKGGWENGPSSAPRP